MKADDILRAAHRLFNMAAPRDRQELIEANEARDVIEQAASHVVDVGLNDVLAWAQAVENNPNHASPYDRGIAQAVNRERRLIERG